MKHVFVETNFLVELVRPVPTLRLRAHELHARALRGDLKLLLPWCAVNEAKRASQAVIQRDYAFRKGLREYAAARHIQADVKVLLARAASEAVDDEHTREEKIDRLCEPIELIPPSSEVVEKTLSLFPVKSLPPFDEMILGAVLSRAEQLRASGQRDLWFCNLNTKDFREEQASAPLAEAYRRVGLTFLENFAVPL